MPGLINSHVHLEFSSNSTTLKYGNFMLWLNSVIASRDELVQKANNKLISKKLEKMKKVELQQLVLFHLMVLICKLVYKHLLM